MARQLIALAPSLLHKRSPSRIAVRLSKDAVKEHRENVPVSFWWRSGWASDVDFVESGWTFLFFLFPQPVTSHFVQHHRWLTRRIFCLCPTPYIPWRHGPSRVTSSMPRRKASERDQPHRRRSRNGCLNCRRRKIRCDEEAPSCGYCIARGLTCSRGGVVLKWEAEYADNGLAFGRQGVGPAAQIQGSLST
jgi:hypothetical protein